MSFHFVLIASSFLVCGCIELYMLVIFILSLIRSTTFRKHQRRHEKVLEWTHKTALASIICDIISEYLWSIEYYILYIDFNSKYNNNETIYILNEFAHMIHVCGLFTWGMFLIFRLEQSFVKSSYQLNKSTLIFLAIIVLINTTFLILFHFNIMIKLSSMISIITFVLIILTVTYLFSIKLLSLTILMRRSIGIDKYKYKFTTTTTTTTTPSTMATPLISKVSSPESINTSINTIDDENIRKDSLFLVKDLTDRQIKMVDIIGKQTVLSFGLIIMMLGWFFNYFAFNTFPIIKNEKIKSIAYIIIHLCTHIGISLCIILSFSFCHKKYQNICGLFHKLSSKCFEKIAIYQINKNNRNSNINTNSRNVSMIQTQSKKQSEMTTVTLT